MSLTKCDNAETCSLAVPATVIFLLDLLHLWVGLSLFCLQIPPDVTVILFIVVVRSWKTMHRRLDMAAQLELQVDQNGLLFVNESARRYSGEGPKTERIVEGCAGHISIGRKVNDVPERVVTQRQGTVDAKALRQYTCCRSVRVPGCILLTLVDGSAKPLEILVFYRYYQRQFYQRLLRQLAFM